jgi:hypothetical protein
MREQENETTSCFQQLVGAVCAIQQYHQKLQLDSLDEIINCINYYISWF